ncbi:MAG: hypothetical protein WD534_03030 [Phycisphaeraceae bacterium]
MLHRARIVISLAIVGFWMCLAPAKLDADITSIAQPAGDVQIWSDWDYASYRLSVDTTQPMDVVFEVDSPSSNLLYTLDVGLLNASGVDWTGLRLELGSGTHDAFVRAGDQAGVTFDTTTVDYKGAILDVDEPELLVWEQAPVLQGNLGWVGFGLNLPSAPNPETDTYSFTLRHTPLVPEPASSLLLAPLVVGGLGRRSSYAANR